MEAREWWCGCRSAPREGQLALESAPLTLPSATARAATRELRTARFRAACSRDHVVRRTLSKPRLYEPIAQNPVTIVPSASPTRNERSSTR